MNSNAVELKIAGEACASCGPPAALAHLMTELGVVQVPSLTRLNNSIAPGVIDEFKMKGTAWSELH